MVEFSKIRRACSFRVPHGRKNPIEINLAPYEGIVDYRKIAITCNAVPIKQVANDHLPNSIELYLYSPKKFLADQPGVPLNQKDIPPPPVPTPVQKYNDFYDNYISLYWDMAPHDAGLSRWLTLHADGNWDDNPNTWPGLRSRHAMDLKPHWDNWPQAVKDGIPLRVTTILEDAENKLLLLLGMWRRTRNAAYAVMYKIDGAITDISGALASYVPLTIVYCPPGEDMTNSHEEVKQHATRVTMGYKKAETDIDFRSITVGAGFEFFDAVGVHAEYENVFSSSQTSGHMASDTLRLSNTQGTIITANNQRAIGRAYWGPLGDLFVVLENCKVITAQIFEDDPVFGARLDPTLPPCRKLIIPMHSLLRPDGDPITSRIEWKDRKEILLRNPFIKGRNRVEQEEILEKVNAGEIPIEEAVDPHAHPCRYNPSRAVRITSLGMGVGSEVNYYESKKISWEKVVTEEEVFETSMTDLGSIGGGYIGQVNAKIGDTLTIRYQTTKEVSETEYNIVTAKCYLIRNQNNQVLGDIDVYYDTHFGTFMFRRPDPIIPGVIIPPVGVIIPPVGFVVVIGGIVSNTEEMPFSHETIDLVDKSTNSVITTVATENNGTYAFHGVKAGDYIVRCGGVEKEIKIKQEDIKKKWIQCNLRNAKKTLDLRRARIIDIMKAFDLSGQNAIALMKKAPELTTKPKIFKHLKLSKEEQEAIMQKYQLVAWKRARGKTRRVKKRPKSK